MAEPPTHLFIALRGVLQTFSSTLPHSRSTQHLHRTAAMHLRAAVERRFERVARFDPKVTIDDDASGFGLTF